MKTVLESNRVAKLTSRQAGYRCGVVLSWALLSLVGFTTSGNHIRAQAQAPTTARPAASPETKPGQKTGSTESAAPASPIGPIKGRVVSDDGRPVTNANLMAQGGPGSLTQKATRVDAEGRFAFDELPAAAYVIIAMAPGYIDQSISKGDPSQWPRHLIGTQLKITMIKGGVITGTVTDSKGQPVVGVPVTAATATESSAISTYLMGLGGGAESDDRGVYRIFGLLPGQYTVTAGGGGPFGQFSASGFDLDVPTYYPSATRDTALPVTVRAGEETTGIDIKYRGAEGHSISGVVTGVIETNAALGVVTVLLSHAGTSSVLSLGVASPVDQRRVFRFNGVADGEYDLLASFQSGPNDEPLVGTKRITVRGGDVTGIEVKLSLLASIAGTITLDPIKPEDKCDKRPSQLAETVITTPRDEPKKSGSQVMTQLFAAYGVMLNAKGEFTARNLEAGKYRLAITLPTDAWYVRSIILPAPAAGGPQAATTTPRPGDAWQGVVTVKSGERASAVSIMIGQDAAGLRGRVAVTPEATAIPAGLRVYLVPAERSEANNVLRYSETLVNRDGSFAFTNLAPGRYFIIARLEPAVETESTRPRPSAWDATTRLKVQREAKTANTVVELKPCQRLVDYALALKANQ